MPNCPSCKTGVNTPTKTWVVLGEPDKQGVVPRSTVGIYECPKCGGTFNSVVGSLNLRIVKEKDWKSLQERLEGSQKEATLLAGKVTDLEGERTELLQRNRTMEEEIGILRLTAEAQFLEGQISGLNEAVRTLQDDIKAASTPS